MFFAFICYAHVVRIAGSALPGHSLFLLLHIDTLDPVDDCSTFSSTRQSDDHLPIVIGLENALTLMSLSVTRFNMCVVYGRYECFFAGWCLCIGFYAAVICGFVPCNRDCDAEAELLLLKGRLVSALLDMADDDGYAKQHDIDVSLGIPVQWHAELCIGGVGLGGDLSSLVTGSQLTERENLRSRSEPNWHMLAHIHGSGLPLCFSEYHLSLFVSLCKHILTSVS